ncbi:hypothetical protein [Geomonas sp.]|uniref:hypothetical protein n=1 Tax=Geomonas sp. TaxID=2651584 RepID=UPI002B484066|nr:hypothetical protein [Geomonas sp.]HJV33822.1 hypothetical protein [Geomonas sp.]
MRKPWSLIGALALVCATALPALADVTDYLGPGEKPSRCPKTIVVRPELLRSNVISTIDSSDLETASHMIGSTVANRYDGSLVIAAKDLDQYRVCNVPVVLSKLKSYTTQSAIFGQREGTATVTILHFASTNASDPDKQIEVSATGERHWGDDVPFMNAVKAVCEKIQTAPF